MSRTEHATVDGYDGVRLRAGDLEATFIPALACVGASLVQGGDELLVQRGGARAYADHGSTFGIPLLHPWANRLAEPSYRVAGRDVEIAADAQARLLHRDPNGLPIHGCLPAAMPFAVAEATFSGREAWLEAVLDTAAAPAVLEVFPFAHRLTVEARLDPRGLQITTTLLASGGDPVPVAFGWHPYLHLPGVARDRWLVRLPPAERVVVDERMLPSGETAPWPGLDGPLADHVYDTGLAGLADGTAFELAGGGREITVRFLSGYPFGQIYAPAEGELICPEPTTAPTDALRSGTGLHVLAPGESWQGVFRIDAGSI